MPPSRTPIAFHERSGVHALPSWHPIQLREHLEKREGTMWRREDTQLLLQRAEEIDALIENLMCAAGVKIRKEQYQVFSGSTSKFRPKDDSRDE
jgi:hypothetical protein